MKRTNGFIATICLNVAVLVSVPASAAPYADDLGKCFIESTTTEDRVDLIRWIFAGVSAHPAVADISAVTPVKREEAGRRTGGLFERLLTETCREKTEKAMRYEGQTALNSSFQVLGQVAMSELITNPEVAAAMAALDQYMDAKKLEAVAKGKGAASAPSTSGDAAGPATGQVTGQAQGKVETSP